MRFEPRFLDEIRSRLPLSVLVGRRVRLKKQGREFCGLSPFNPERTPSFFVNDQKGFYHCFSSGRHGDHFRFLMETEGLSFPEAVAEAARAAGLGLPAGFDPGSGRAARIAPAELVETRRRKGIVTTARALGLTLRPSGGTLVGPCPACGGSATSSRFEVKPGPGVWLCAACQSGGDAIALVRTVRGCGFAEAYRFVASVPDRDPAEAEASADRSAEFRERERRRLYALWRAAAPAAGSPVEDYFRLRRLVLPPTRALRFVAALPFFHGEEADERSRSGRRPRAIHVGPAMIAAMVDGDGRFRGLHQTWIDLANPPKGKATIVDPDTGEILPAKKMRGSKRGACIELVAAPDARRLIAGEGIETVAAVWSGLVRRGRPVDGIAFRVAGDLGNLAGKATASLRHPTARTDKGRPLRVPGPDPDLEAPAMPVPDAVDDVVWLGDGDSDRFTTEQVLVRACRRHARPGRTNRIAWAADGMDFNDMAMAAGAPAAPDGAAAADAAGRGAGA